MPSLILLRRLFFSLFIISALFYVPTRVYAQEATPINVTLSPTSLRMETNPGQETTDEIKIRNNGEKTENLQITVGKFIADESGEKPILLDPEPNDEFLKWLSFEKTDVSIEPGQWETIKVTFSPPAEAALSYFYAIYFSRSKQEINPGSTNLIGSPAIMVLTTVNSPNAIRELRLAEFNIQNEFLEFLPQSFEAKITNTGNVNIVPKGSIFIDGQGKKDIEVLPINSNNSVILPNSSRSFSVTWDNGFPVYQKGSLLWNFNKITSLRFGRYTANLILVYDNGERDVPVESSVSFWVFPTRIVLAILLIPTLPALIIYLIMRWRMKKYVAAKE